jgi:hypothetical protein
VPRFRDWCSVNERNPQNLISQLAFFNERNPQNLISQLAFLCHQLNE